MKRDEKRKLFLVFKTMSVIGKVLSVFENWVDNTVEISP